jgi:biopolymer transport protein ExbB/TolQ
MFSYLSNASAITFIVIATLSFYFISAIYIFLYRYKIIKYRLRVEQESLNSLYASNSTNPNPLSIFATYKKRDHKDLEKILKAAINDTVRIFTSSLTYLSIIASTSPFIGLFGTVVGILEAFSRLGDLKSASLNVVAPAISEALIATAVGIFVAVFAYSFHLILKRKIYELSSVLESELDIIASRENKSV